MITRNIICVLVRVDSHKTSILNCSTLSINMRGGIYASHSIKSMIWRMNLRVIFFCYDKQRELPFFIIRRSIWIRFLFFMLRIIIIILRSRSWSRLVVTSFIYSIWDSFWVFSVRILHLLWIRPFKLFKLYKGTFFKVFDLLTFKFIKRSVECITITFTLLHSCSSFIWEIIHYSIISLRLALVFISLFLSQFHKARISKITREIRSHLPLENLCQWIFARALFYI